MFVKGKTTYAKLLLVCRVNGARSDCAGLHTVVLATLKFVSVAFIGAYIYRVGYYDDLTRSHVAFATTYILFLSPVFAYLAYKRFRIGIYIGAVVATLFIDATFLMVKILVLPNYFMFLILAVEYTTTQLILYYFSKVLFSNGNKQ